jgi:hypothetical protein
MSSFVERLAASSVGKKVGGQAEVRPALTPEMIPEALRAPSESAPLRPAATRELRAPKPEREPAAGRPTLGETRPRRAAGASGPPTGTESEPLAPEPGESQAKTPAPPRQREAETSGPDVSTGPAPSPTQSSSPTAEETGAPLEARSEIEASAGQVPEPPSTSSRDSVGSGAGSPEEPEAEGLPMGLESPEAPGLTSRATARPLESGTPEEPPNPSQAEVQGRAATELREEAPEQPSREGPQNLSVEKAASNTTEEPVVTINIGRIEVRAINPERSPAVEAGPALSLKEYMKQRSERER